MKELEKFKFLEHTADIKFRSYGNTLNEVFENCILAIAYYMSQGEKISSPKGRIIEVFGQDTESLLYNFLDEILYLIDAENFIPIKGNVTIRGNNLKAELFGDETGKYHLEHIKAATYAEMYIKKEKNVKNPKEEHWEAQVVLDV